MHASAWVMAAVLAATATGATAETRVVPTVISASARWATAPNTVTVGAVVQLNDSCWSNPRFQPPLVRGPSPPGSTAPIEVVADYASGMMCAQVVRQVPVPALDWRIYPNPRLRAVKVIGSARPVTVNIGR